MGMPASSWNFRLIDSCFWIDVMAREPTTRGVVDARFLRPLPTLRCRRIKNLQVPKLVVVVIFDGFSNGLFVGFLYTCRTFGAPTGHYTAPDRPNPGRAN